MRWILISILMTICSQAHAQRWLVRISYWEPDDAGTELLGWYDATDPDNVITSAVGNCSQWNDISGNSNHLENSNGGQQPNWEGTGLAGMGSLYFSSTHDKLFTDEVLDLYLTNGWAIITVGMGATGDSPNYGVLKDLSGLDKIDARQSSSGVDGKVWASAKFDGTGVSLNSARNAILAEYVPMVQAVYYDTDALTGRANGGIVSDSKDAPDDVVFLVDTIQAGRESNTPRNYNSEMIVLQVSNEDTIERCEGYLAHKYEIPLDPSHPYYSAPPRGGKVQVLEHDGVVLVDTKPLWSPSNTTVSAWYDAVSQNTMTTNASGAIEEWADISGNGHTLKQLTEDDRPETGVRTIAGLNAVDFVRTNDDFMETDGNVIGLTISNAFVAFVATIDDVSSQNGYFTLSGTGAVGQRWGADVTYSDGTIIYDCGWNSGNPPNRLNPATGWTDGTNVVMGFYCSIDDDVQQIWQDGAMISGTTTGQQITASAGLHIGTSDTASTADTALGEFIVINGTLSTDLRTRLEGYLAWRWGLEKSLPISHPYWNHPPTQ